MYSAPPDSFHLIKEGVGKMIIFRLFEQSDTKETRDILLEWSTAYESMKVFSETARCTRQIAVSGMKGNELGICIYAAFPLLVNILGRRGPKWFVLLSS